jgi:hypothetical protein
VFATQTEDQERQGPGLLIQGQEFEFLGARHKILSQLTFLLSHRICFHGGVTQAIWKQWLDVLSLTAPMTADMHLAMSEWPYRADQAVAN